MSVIDLNTYAVQPEALKLIPEATARKYNIIPLALVDDALQVGMSETNNILALQEVGAIAKMRIEPVLVDPNHIRAAIDLNYKAYKEIEQQLGDSVPEVRTPRDALLPEVSDTPIVRALDRIISEAVKVRATDIHIEPQEDRVRVRYRIDSVLHDTMSLPLAVHMPLISRIKVVAGMDIADHKPQDGQFSLQVRNKSIDIRVATVDTICGEMSSLRILDKAFAHRTLSQLGFLADSLEQYEAALKSPLGMILVCGPTGSGKTTTLYASINSLDCIGRKVVTIEDPVEYRFRDVVQIQINTRAGLTFASGLRSLMRHNPDVVLVGEIRDPDTAQIAAQLALTGQLVLSSVHASDAISSLFRLLDLGCGRFNVAATVIGVVSQRMARRVCPHCCKPMPAPPEAQLAYEKEMGEARTEFLYGTGCNACAGTGYLGQVPIIEILSMNQQLRVAFLSGAGTDQLRAVARSSGMVPMWRDGMLKVKAGITTPSEVLRNVLLVGLE
ncbi:MAG: type II/IV secretion system protein [Chloroflexi bacterium]|nr:type II/IV secretion system protein [Chloroflexota bacterium]